MQAQHDLGAMSEDDPAVLRCTGTLTCAACDADRGAATLATAVWLKTPGNARRLQGLEKQKRVFSPSFQSRQRRARTAAGSQVGNLLLAVFLQRAPGLGAGRDNRIAGAEDRGILIDTVGSHGTRGTAAVCVERHPMTALNHTSCGA